MSTARLVWIVTGSSSGIGEQLVKCILTRGDLVVATARRFESIKHLENLGATIMQLDITDTQASIDATIAQAKDVYGRVDVLVNNASYVQIGAWEELE